MDPPFSGFVLLVLFGAFTAHQVFGSGGGGGLSLVFEKEPEGKVDFINTKGVEVECSARGTPSPTVQWTSADGSPVSSIAGLREVQSSGKVLRFPAFTADKYRIDVHSAVYRCSASNSAGSIVSRDVIVNGVVAQSHDIQVYDTFAIEGNTAVFKCHVPSVLLDYVKVTSWIKNDNLLIKPTSDDSIDEKYALMPTGELHIRNVSKGDSGSKYRCKTVNRLTGVVKDSSNTGQLIATASHGSVPPRIVDSYSTVTVTEKHKSILGCVTQGNPSPNVNWFKKSPLGQLVPLRIGGKIIQTKSLLLIKDAQKSDAGVYVCQAVNEMGKEQLDITLIVIEPLIVDIKPSVQQVKLNERVVFKCEVKGNPSAFISWMHNGRLLSSKGNELVVENVEMSDRGLYQCRATNNIETVQSVTELQLSEILPYFEDTFNETNIQPGSSISLKCVASGIPLPNIVWKLDETTIHNKPRFSVTTKFDTNGKIISILKMEKLTVEDGGLYSCKASNTAGSLKYNAKINVYGPLGTRPMQEHFGTSSQNIILNCPVYGYPIANTYWEKNGEMLPFNMRQSVFSNGSLGIFSTSKQSDTGIYKCTANDGSSRKVDAKVKLTIMVPPKIVPFEFQEDLLREGMRARLQCVVSEGDLPLNVTWLKDEKPFSDNLGVTVRSLDEFSSILTINSINPRHNGRYTCVASNRAATVTHSARLSVNVAPKIVPFEFVGNHFEGSPARVVCGLQEGDAPIQFSWLHNNDPAISSNTLNIHETDGLSSILSISNLSAEHKGTYTCIAKNGAGVDRHQAALHIHVPPKIVPFEFQDEQLIEGMLARISCIVSRGDLPLKFEWEKNGKFLAANMENVLIKSFDEHSSILTIQNLTAEHNGDYACLTSNAAGLARHSSQLVVKVPPRWIIKPKTASSVIGHDIKFDCQVYGFPEPTITWWHSKKIGHDSIIKRLLNSDNIQLLSNGSLLISKVGSSDHGYYICKASNGIGEELSSAVQLNLNAPPHFKNIVSSVDGAVDKQAQLQCLVEGDPPMKINWFKNDKLIQDTQSKLKIQSTNTASDALSILSISKTTKNDQGNYICSAANQYGINQTIIKFIVRGLPSAPFDLKASSIESSSFELIWKITKDENDPIQKFTIQYKQEHESWDNRINMETVNGEPTNSIISNLMPATSYLFRMYSQNTLGKSLPSQILRISTLENAPSKSPVNIQVESVNTETFKVLWKAPEEKYWNGKLQGYYVGYKEVDTNDPYLFKTLLTPDPSANDLHVQIGGLKQFTKYAVVVLAYNSQGKGPESEPVIVMTSEGAPSLPPTDVRCTILTSQSIHVTWFAPSSDSINGILRGYKVLYKPVSDWFDDLAENFNISLPTALTIINMEKFTNYSIQVLAMTKAGSGPKSEAVYCKTLDDIPCPSTDVKAIATTEDSVIVSWKAPECPNGILKSYSIYWKITGESKAALSHSVSNHDNHFEVTSLKKGKRYEFWVSASTMAGEGKPSRTIIQTPSGPTVPAKVISFDEKIVTPWKSDINLACQAVGLPEPQKKWMFNGQPLERNSRARISSEGALTINGIEENESGDYNCQVKNDFGEDKIVYTIIVLAPPSAPVTDLTKITSNSIEIQWKIPTSKMSRIKGYTIHTRRDVGEWKEITIGSESRNHVLMGLDCGTKYEIYMTAFNKIGLGQPSDLLVVSTNGSVPAAPSKTDLIEESSNSISLYLNTWKSNGCPILYYMVEYAIKSAKDWTFVSNNIKPEQRRLVIRSLRSATWYSLRMTAHNSAGSSVAEYNFATLTENGGTISPDLMSDSTNDPIDGIFPFLNFYIIVPIACTIIILLTICGAAWFYIKIKSRDENGGCGAQQMDSFAPQMATLRRGNSSESFAYMQRGTMKSCGGRSANICTDGDLAPYATFQLNQRPFDSIPPPLPPPRNNEYQNENRNAQFYLQGATGNMMFPAQMNQGMETTFIFPSLQMDNSLPIHQK